jgi:putative ABC transport system permease protein
MAITLVLVIGAGLLGRSLKKVLEVNPGFRVDKIVTMDISLPWANWTDLKSKSAQGAFYSNLIDRLRQIPGVQKVGATSGIPMDEGLPDGMFLLMSPDEMPRRPLSDEELSRTFGGLFQQKQRLGVADYCAATAGYFQALGIPLVRGRMFDDRDTPDAPHVALISESLAQARWPGQDPIGHTIRCCRHPRERP